MRWFPPSRTEPGPPSDDITRTHVHPQASRREAVAALRERGFDAHRLEGGWPEWQAEGRPVVG